MEVMIQIKGDPRTGAVQTTGHIDDMRVVHWLLGECLRIRERRAAQREAGQNDGSGLVVVQGMDLPPPRA